MRRYSFRVAEAQLGQLPLCQRVIRDAHHEPLNGVRGQHSAPSEYRTIPDWLGPAVCSIDQARFVPMLPTGCQRR